MSHKVLKQISVMACLHTIDTICFPVLNSKKELDMSRASHLNLKDSGFGFETQSLIEMMEYEL